MNKKQVEYIQKKQRNKSLIMTVIIIAFILFFCIATLTSCTSQRKINKICATCPTETIIQHDSIVTNTIDTIYRTSILDSLMFISTIDRTKQIDTVYFQDNTWKASFYVSETKLKAHIEHLSDSIDTIIKSKETTVKQAESSIIEVPVEKIVAKYNKFFWFLFIWFIISILGIVFYVWKSVTTLKIDLD